MNKQEVETYLEGWKSTSSTEMDKVFRLFKSDVNDIANAYRMNMLSIYSKEEYLNYLSELEADDPELDFSDERDNADMADVVVEIDGDGGTYYLF